MFDLDGFNGSPTTIIGFPVPHSCPHPIDCMLGVMDMHCNFILGVTTLYCLPVLFICALPCSFCFPNVGLSAVFAWHFIHKPSSLLFSTGMHLFTFMRVCLSVFSVLIDAKYIADFLKLLSQTMDVRGATFGYRRICLLKYMGHCGSSSQQICTYCTHCHHHHHHSHSPALVLPAFDCSH